MPGLSKPISAFPSTDALPADVPKVLRTVEARANTIYPSLLSFLSATHTPSGQVWIIARDARDRIGLVIACTDSDMGKNPLFILSLDSNATAYLPGAIAKLRKKILDRRVYSIFAPRPVAEVFAALWYAATGVLAVKELYYDSYLSVCTRGSLRIQKDKPVDSAAEIMELGTPADVKGISELCHAFAVDSAPFTLTPTHALREANLLVAAQQVYVLRLRAAGGGMGIACIVAVTRTSPGNATITKVYTNTAFRGRGCAKRLVGFVTRRLLYDEGKSSVSLYVGRMKGAARSVYHSVGFEGLDIGAEKAENWIEIGFDKKKVVLGHW